MVPLMAPGFDGKGLYASPRVIQSRDQCPLLLDQRRSQFLEPFFKDTAGAIALLGLNLSETNSNGASPLLHFSRSALGLLLLLALGLRLFAFAVQQEHIGGAVRLSRFCRQQG